LGTCQDFGLPSNAVMQMTDVVHSGWLIGSADENNYLHVCSNMSEKVQCVEGNGAQHKLVLLPNNMLNFCLTVFFSVISLYVRF
jgi:hypothetical protein